MKIKHCPPIFLKWTTPKQLLYNQGVYSEKRLRLTVHRTRSSYNEKYIAIKPLVQNYQTIGPELAQNTRTAHFQITLIDILKFNLCLKSF